MDVIPTQIPDVIVLEPTVYTDGRGFLYESYNKRVFEKARLSIDFVQENHSRSIREVLRGLHYQIRQPQGKLVRVVVGEIFDVAVDIRRSSPSFGKWVGVNLSAGAGRMLWVPEGFAHGFLVLSENAEVLYKTTDYYAPEFERTILWNDADISIGWPIRTEPILSKKDRSGQLLKDAEVFG